MQIAWQIFKRHPIAITFYLLYLTICYHLLANILLFHKQVKIHPEKSGVANGGEIIGYSWVFLIFLAGIFVVSALINIAFTKTQHKFYLWLCTLIIIPLIIISNI